MKKIMQTAAAAAVVCMLAAPALAATQWNFGASLQYNTFWNERDFGRTGGEDLQGGGAGLKSDGRLDWSTSGDSTIFMEMASDHLEGYIEMKWDTEENKVTTSAYWGKYNFNEDFNILLGQTDPLYIQEISNQVIYDNMNMNSIGTANSDTLPMIALGYKGFTFAMAKPVTNQEGMIDLNSASYEPVIGTPLDLTYDLDTFMPQLQASYAYEADVWRIKLAGAYANTKIKKLEDATIGSLRGSKTIHSWLLGMDGQVYFGPLTLGAAVSYGQNWETAGWNESELALGHALIKPNAGLTSYKISDTNTLMLSAVAGYQLTEALYFEGGVGYRRDDNNMFEDANDTFAAYLQAVYTVAPGFSIIPEIGYIDYGDNTGFKWAGTKSGDKKSLGYEWYAGAQWRMDF